jgi:hypothetical protein
MSRFSFIGRLRSSIAPARIGDMPRTTSIVLALCLALPLSAAVMKSPAGAGSSSPNLATAQDGSVLMIWVEGQAVRFARLKSSAWSEARTIASNDRVNPGWANGPAIAQTSDGALLALWTEKNPAGPHAVDAFIATSRDNGATWSAAKAIHGKTKPSEYGFASVVPNGSGFGVTWLDGRNMESEEAGGMALRYANVGADGALTGERVIDDRVCECCTTGMTLTARGPVVAYRERGEGDVRDIAVAPANGAARVAHRDNWVVKGCPVNGPQLDANGNSVALTWFTAANGQARVLFAWSRDGGATFGPAVRVDDGKPSGRADVVIMHDGSALVTWIEGMGATATLRRRLISGTGEVIPSTTIAPVDARMMPRVARSGRNAYFAWTDGPREKRQVRVASLN